jgi:PAS domain S-box-containing protein
MTAASDSLLDAPAPEAVKALLDASAMLLASDSVDGVLSGIVDLARRVIKADAYAVWRTYDAAHWRVLASSGLSPSYRTELRAATQFAPVFQAIPDVHSDSLVHAYSKIYQQEGIRSMLVVPLQLQNPMPDGPNAGTITFYWRTPRSFSDLDVAYVSTLTNLSSAALNISELHEQNRRERERLAFLAEASALLASSLDYETTLQRVAHLAVPHFADWCTVHVIENGVPNRLVVAHADPAMLEYAREYSAQYPEKIRDDQGLGLVLRTGQSEIYSHITDEMLVAAIQDPEHLKAVRRLGLTASILVPLTSQGRILGAIRLLAAGGNRNFTRDDVRLAEDLARRAAAAIENAQLHRAVLDQENRLRLAHSAAKMGTWTWDLVQQKPSWSDEWKALYGISPDTESTFELGQSLIHPEDREQVMREFNEVLASDAELLSVEHRSITPDGRTLWVHSRGRIGRDGDGNATSIVGITMDITERRLAEEALRRTEKLAAAGRLAATVAHEINNPLESIVNLVYLCKGTPGLPAETASFLNIAEDELIRIAQIVRQTLGFYRESVNPRDSDIGGIVSQTLDLYLRRIDSRSLSYTVDVDPGLSAHVVPGEIKQVVANLIANAIDATAPGGLIAISAARAGDSVAITVRDNGSGIEDAILPHLFEPFFTTKTDVGTGLGLWVSKGIVEKHRGSIAVISSIDPADHGTAITVALPMAEAMAAR